MLELEAGPVEVPYGVFCVGHIVQNQTCRREEVGHGGNDLATGEEFASSKKLNPEASIVAFLDEDGGCWTWNNSAIPLACLLIIG
jgi:hypothetical protein